MVTEGGSGGVLGWLMGMYVVAKGSEPSRLVSRVPQVAAWECAVSQNRLLPAATGSGLHGRTPDGPEGTEDAAVPCPGTQNRVAVDALVEEAAGIERHLFNGGVAAVRTGEEGLECGDSRRH